jgi:hypothetical protein
MSIQQTFVNQINEGIGVTDGKNTTADFGSNFVFGSQFCNVFG